MPVRRPLTASAAAALLCLARHSRVFTSPLPLRPPALPRLRRTATWSSGGREMNDVLRSVSGKAVAEQKVAASGVGVGAVTPEEAVQRLLQAAGPGAGSPPPEVVGAALKATNVAPTAENVRRALEMALGGAAPTAAQVATAMRTATDGLPDNFFEAPAPGADVPGSIPKPTTPEEVVEVLKMAAGPSAGQPPADVVGTALRRAGLEITADNVLRALKAANPGAGEPSSKDLGDALKAAMAEPGPEGYGVGPTSSQLPGGAQTGGVPPAGGVPPVAMQTPEEVVRALLQIAGADAGQPPPEILGTALQASGLPVTRDNVLRALRAAGVGGGSPTEEDVQKALAGAQAPATAQPAAPATPEEVIFALRMAAGPGAGTPPPEVVGAALHQAKVSPLSAEAVVRALKEAGHTSPSPEVVQAALQAAVSGQLPKEMQ
mmetsp:Transcript_50343/g.80446  ORF Transcript_50343/g.80446 Transcript_50343/m.80446 type:complete len:433 (-) Transcript_50343:106-1404(-)